MLDTKSKYSTNLTIKQEKYTVKSVLQPDFSPYNLNRITIVWFRQPPPPYQIQELSCNQNKISYRCSSLDFECCIICKVIDQSGKQLNRFDFGPIQTFFYNRLSANLELRVQVNLFNSVKKCIFSFNSIPTLINPINSNKYNFTTQDIKSIYVKAVSSQQQEQKQKENNNEQILFSARKKNSIIVGNLFQRLILLKLFHEIPNGMYCHSMDILQISFYDESSCNIALLAINRFKYQKKLTHQTSKSMFNSYQPQDLGKSKFMKKSNQQLNKFKNKPIDNSQSDSKIPLMRFQIQPKEKQSLLQMPVLLKFKKQPKQSVTSGKQSVLSVNSSNPNKSRSSLASKNFQSNLVAQAQNKQLNSQDSKQHTLIKNPKISVLSTQITSIKGRQQQSSFPQTPTSNLKSSQLLKPKEFRSPLSLRRSQQEIKTPRMDTEQEKNTEDLPNKKKSCSSFRKQINQENNDNKDEKKYVDQFENILYDPENEQSQQEMCLNDSFAKLEQEQEKQRKMTMAINTDQNIQVNQQLLKTTSPSSPTKSQRNIISTKQKFMNLLNENYQLKKKNEKLLKEIQQFKANSDKHLQINRFRQEIQQMKKVQQNLKKQIQILKDSSKNKQKKFYNNIQKFEKKSGNDSDKTNNFYLCSAPRQSKHKSDWIDDMQSSNSAILQQKSKTSAKEHYQSRKIQENKLVEKCVKNGKKVGFLHGSGQLKFFKLQQDQYYQKFRNNQSYSYKPLKNIQGKDQTSENQV